MPPPRTRPRTRARGEPSSVARPSHRRLPPDPRRFPWPPRRDLAHLAGELSLLEMHRMIRHGGPVAMRKRSSVERDRKAHLITQEELHKDVNASARGAHAQNKGASPRRQAPARPYDCHLVDAVGREKAEWGTTALACAKGLLLDVCLPSPDPRRDVISRDEIRTNPRTAASDAPLLRSRSQMLLLEASEKHNGAINIRGVAAALPPVRQRAARTSECGLHTRRMAIAGRSRGDAPAPVALAVSGAYVHALVRFS